MITTFSFAMKKPMQTSNKVLFTSAISKYFYAYPDGNSIFVLLLSEISKNYYPLFSLRQAGGHFIFHATIKSKKAKKQRDIQKTKEPYRKHAIR